MALPLLFRETSPRINKQESCFKHEKESFHGSGNSHDSIGAFAKVFQERDYQGVNCKIERAVHCRCSEVNLRKVLSSCGHSHDNVELRVFSDL